MKKVVLFFLVFIGFNSLSSLGQDYKYHSVFIYNFTKYIQWPSSYQTGDFVVGVLGNSEVVPHLEKMASAKTVGSQKMVVKVFKDAASIGKCHILFIPSDKSNIFEDAFTKIASEPTLLVTERPGLGKKGSSINFIIVEGKYKFELNQESIASSQLKVSSELSKLAILL
jgi:hypothetical protein